MNNLRKYGNAPFDVVVVHGGPGAPGEMAPAARKLSEKQGVLEPLQTKNTIDGQIKELKTMIETSSDKPVVLIGWSWGAWLAFILAARHPKLVRKLILISSGPFKSKYVEQIMTTRLSRLSDEEKGKFNSIVENLDKLNRAGKDKAFSQIGKILDKADCHKPISHKSEVLKVQYKIYDKVWKEASILRESGKLLKLGKLIQCPVVAIHGDYDPHPAEGVEKPLTRVLKHFKFILLEHCGHCPWNEKEAKEKFFKTLMEELK